MSKFSLSSILGGFNLAAINDRFKKIETELNEKVLYRNNPEGEANQMHNDLDMNGYKLLNVTGIEVELPDLEYDIPVGAIELPKPIGLAPAVGVSERYAREDHVHIGLNGAPGEQGVPGNSNAIAYAYKRSATPPVDKPGDVTFDFYTGKISTPIGDVLANGWSKVIPEGTEQLYVCIASASANSQYDTIAEAEWSGAVMLATNGTAGLNAATIYIYQRTPTPAPPLLPDVGVTYTFNPPTVADLSNGWTSTIPDVVNGDYLWVSTASAASTLNVDTIPPSEWAAPQIMGQKGEAGVDGASGGLNNAIVYAFIRSTTEPTTTPGDITYSFVSGSITIPGTLPNGWSKSIPAGTDPLWVRSCSASNSASTDTIADAEWSAPVMLMKNGIDGLNSATVFIYKRNTVNVVPALPTADTTYTFATKSLTGLTEGWTTTVPSATGGNYLFVSTATAVSTGLTDTLPASEWAAATLFSESGVQGVSTGVAYAYKRAATAPVDNPGAVVFDFASGTITTPSGDALANGWTKTMPIGLDPLYVVVASASGSGTDAIAATEWASPVVLSGPGLNVATVYAYQRTSSNSPPTKPSASCTYTFSTATLTGLNNGWTTTLPALSGGEYLWAITATASSNTDSDTLTTGEWATPQVLSKNGTSGTSGSDGQNGTRGTVTVAKAISGSTWSNSEATSALSAAGYFPAINRDVVTLYNTGASFSETRFYDNGSWVVLNAYINGNMLVSGTLSADKISGGSITGSEINIASGNFRVYLSDGRASIRSQTGNDITLDNTSNPTVNPLKAYAKFGTKEVILAENTSGSTSSHGIRGKAKFYGTSAIASGVVGASNGYDFYAEGDGTNYGPFTGAHDCLIYPTNKPVSGDIVVDEKCISRTTLSNTIFQVARSSQPEQPNVIGVFVAERGTLVEVAAPAAFVLKRSEDGDTYTPEYEVAKPYFNVGSMNAVGEGQINVCGMNGDIQPGDLIVTSSIAGKGMKQNDGVVRNITVAKAREGATFDSPTQVKQIACIYMCG